MTAVKTVTPEPRSPRRPPVRFDVSGEGIFLQGDFRRWQSGLSMGPDLDELTVQMLVDASSPEDLTILSSASAEEPLFSFHSREVKQKSDTVYRARGVLESPTGSHTLDLVIEVPLGHNAYFAVAFTAQKDDLGETWRLLVPSTRTNPSDIDAERRLDPRTGVRPRALGYA